VTSTRTRTPTAAESPRWLADEQQAAWRAFNGAMHKLRWALECQLQHDAGLSFLEYHALAALSENPGHTNAILTPAGLRLLAASAPGHVARVRELVIDALSPAELRHLRAASERILERIEAGAH
jgi:DNA-binding MarR family transcriptional regulator